MPASMHRCLLAPMQSLNCLCMPVCGSQAPLQVQSCSLFITCLHLSPPCDLHLLPLLQIAALPHLQLNPSLLPLPHRLYVTLLPPLWTSHRPQHCILLLIPQPAGSMMTSPVPLAGRLKHPALRAPQQKPWWGGQKRFGSQTSS